MLKITQLVSFFWFALISINAVGKAPEVCLGDCYSQYIKCIRPAMILSSTDQKFEISVKERKQITSYLKASSVYFIIKKNEVFAIAEFNKNNSQPKEIALITLCQDERMKCKSNCEKHK